MSAQEKAGLRALAKHAQKKGTRDGQIHCICTWKTETMGQAAQQKSFRRHQIREVLEEVKRAEAGLKPAEVLVEGLWVYVVELPVLLGSYMRDAGRNARDAKAEHRRAEAAEASRLSADAVIRAVLVALGCGFDADPKLKVREMMARTIATQLRAEAAEAKVAAAHDLHKAVQPDCTNLDGSKFTGWICNECTPAGWVSELTLYPCPTITALEGTK